MEPIGAGLQPAPQLLKINLSACKEITLVQRIWGLTGLVQNCNSPYRTKALPNELQYSRAITHQSG